jgi:nucleoside phosphorylase
VPRRAFDLGLIIPSRDEFDCAREILAFDDAFTEGGYFLHPFTVPGSELTGVALVLFDVGQTGSAVAATNLLTLFDLRLLALTGVAGALDNDLRLGDVVVASGVDEYLSAAKATPDGAGFEFQVGGSSWAASSRLVGFVNNFRYLPGYDSWRTDIRSRRDLNLQSQVGALTRDRPDYQVGQVASGDIRGAGSEFTRWLLHHNRRRVALEMESAGAAQAIYQSGRTDLLVIRGISNFADGRPINQVADASWTRYAALNAASLLAALVTNSAFPWPEAPATPVAAAKAATSTPTPTVPAADPPAGHVFLSYANDDSAGVDQVQDALKAAGVRVWRDIDDLLGGQDLLHTIRQAITSNAFVFIAFFSTTSVARTKSYQNAELTLAIEEMRMRRFDLPWLIPVRLDDCEVPDRDIGGGRTLRSLLWIDLFGPGAARQTDRLVRSVLQILSQS